MNLDINVIFIILEGYRRNNKVYNDIDVIFNV